MIVRRSNARLNLAFIRPTATWTGLRRSCPLTVARARLKLDPIDMFIKNILVQERAAEKSYTCDPYTVKWRQSNELGIIFCAVYQELL